MRLLFLILILSALAHPAAAGDADWAADPRTGCRVFAANREPGQIPIWEGACRDGVADGPGRLVWIMGDRPQAMYEGALDQGRMQGPGVFRLANGQRYEGEFTNDSVTGRGVYHWPNGSRYEGGFLDGKFHGHGIRTWPDGARYEGDFLDDKRTGQGVHSWANGESYRGDFIDGRMTGHGT